MLTAAVVGVLLFALALTAVLWRAAVGETRAQARLIRHLRQKCAGYRAELSALSIAAPPAAVAALTPDDPTLLPAEVEQWLREGAN